MTGAIGTELDATSATDQTSRPPPTSVASHDGSRRLDATSAAPKPRPTTVSAKAASDRTHSSPFSGKRRPGELPGRGTGAGRREGGEAQLAQRRSAQRGAPVDGGHEDVAHVGRLDRERPAAAAGPQAHEERERGGDTEPGGPVGAHPLDAGGRQPLVADDGGQHGHHRDDCDPDQVHLVERVDPVDLRYPLPPPRPSKVADDRDGHRERVGHYSSTSSMRVPQIAFGWTNATVVPRDPGRGASSITL